MSLVVSPGSIVDLVDQLVHQELMFCANFKHWHRDFRLATLHPALPHSSLLVSHLLHFELIAEQKT